MLLAIYHGISPYRDYFGSAAADHFMVVQAGILVLLETIKYKSDE